MKTNIFRNNCLLSREGQHFHNRTLQLTVFVQTRFVVSLMVAAAMLFSACSKDDAPPIQQHDTEIIYIQGRHQDIAPEVIKNHTDSAEVRYLYIVPDSLRWTYSTDNITKLIDIMLKPALAVSNKVKGKGRFAFKYPILPTDSLWLVQQGWTVNQ